MTTVRTAVRTLARPKFGPVAGTLALLALLAVSAWAVGDLRINIATLVDSADNAVDFAGRMLPLDFPPIGELLSLTGQTLAIVVCATLLSVVLSMVFAVLAAGNTTPHPTARFGARAVIVAARALPDVVLAIVLFRVFGFGALAGILAMGLHSVGMVGKLYADAIEQIDEGPRSAVRAGGAAGGQELVAGVLPQVLPALVATALHRLDINLRVSVLLGFVGVNGLGYAISTSLQQLDYRRGMALALVVLILCILVELLSGAIRKALLRPTVTIPVPHRPDQTSPQWTFARLRRTGYLALTVIAVVASIWGAGLSASQFFGGLGNLGRTVRLFWPPEFISGLFEDLWETVEIALAGTLIGAILAVPLGVLGARNVAPRVARGFRMLIVAVRGIPELVLAIVFVVISGLGAVAGALAMAIGSIGLLSKLIADSLEEVDAGVEEALRATGASRWQVFFSATLPQAAPSFVAHVLYQLDTNIRAATLLGIVGAGGIGFDLLNASRVLEFGAVTAIIIVVFAVVMIVELLAVWLRRVVR